MNEDEARRVELVRAIEGEDREATLLTREDVVQAEGHARAASTSLAGQPAAEAFLASRAAFASTRLSTRHPGIAGLLQRSRWPRWLGVALPVLALVAGFLANEFGTSKRLDLLAVPLLGTITWNLFVYLWLFVAIFRPKTSHGLDPLYRAVARLAGTGHRDLDRGTALHRAANAFQSRWAAASAPLVGARIARTFHLGAGLFAAGLIGGIYLRALVVEYRAGWESTFLGPGAVHALLSTVLGPASWASGVAIPPLEAMAAMRWIGPTTGGVNAAPWIHLYTVTLVGSIVAPRMLLALWQGARAFRLKRRFPVPGREDFYVRRLLRSAGAAPGTARVTPYAYRPGEETRRRLAAAMRAALGEGAEVRFDEPVDYGGEDRWLADSPGSPEDDYHILLFTLSTTPEEENHGALAAALAVRTARERPGTALAALVDESPYRAHFAGQAGLEDRVAGRLGAWRRVLAPAGLTPLGLDLAQHVDAGLARRIEAGLLPDGAMHG
ncbi:MAG: DUF2868 domain-containing protein [Novosphingobium sp.]